MSALPLIEPQIQPRHRPAPVKRAPQPAQQPVIRRKKKRMSKARSAAIQRACEQSAAFCLVAIATFMLSSLVGHVMVEKSRRDGIAALTRMRLAKKAESELSEQVYALSNGDAVQSWAAEHGYKAPEELIKHKPEKALVAFR